MRRHPEQTYQVLNRVGCFRGLPTSQHRITSDWTATATTAASAAVQLSMPARILCAADICDALRSSRPYRPALPPDRVIDIMGRDVGSGIDPDCFAALQIRTGGSSRRR